MPSRGWVKTLSKEAAGWVQAGLISPAQQEQIRGRYTGQHEYTRLTASILILGAVLIGLGIILFIAANWQILPRPARLAIIVLAVIGFETAGAVQHARGAGRLGDALLLVGAMTFGAGLWLVAQIYQLPYNHADSMLAWTVGSLALAAVQRSAPVLLLGAVGSCAWLIMLMSGQSEWGPLSFLWLEQTVRAPLVRFVPLAAAVGWLAYRQPSRAAVVITLIGSLIWLSRLFWVFWWPDQRTVWDRFDAQVGLWYAGLYAGYALLLYAAGMAHRQSARWARFENVYLLFALMLLFVANFPLTFYVPELRRLPSAGVGAAGDAWWLVILVLLAAVAAAVRWLRAGGSLRQEGQFLLILATLQIGGLGTGDPGTLLPALWFNGLLIGELLAFLYLSYLLRQEQLFRLALYGFAIVILARYFDTVGRMLPRSLFFLVGGLLLIGGGIAMERQRKRLTARMREGT